MTSIPYSHIITPDLRDAVQKVRDGATDDDVVAMLDTALKHWNPLKAANMAQTLFQRGPDLPDDAKAVAAAVLDWIDQMNNFTMGQDGSARMMHDQLAHELGIDGFASNAINRLAIR